MPLGVTLGQVPQISELPWRLVTTAVSITEEYQLRNVLAVILGAIETNNPDLAKQAIRKADDLLAEFRGGRSFYAVSPAH